MSDTLFNPKTEVYSTLSSLGYACTQGSQDVFNEVPAITFSVTGNEPIYDLGKHIDGSNVEITVDIWANDSVTASSIAKEAEVAMRNIDYLLTYLADVPSPQGALYHINMRFDGIK